VSGPDADGPDVELSRFTAILSGRVQGVGFRWSTRRVARDLGLVGEVHNLRDGTVEVIAEGRPQAVAALETWLAAGPGGARVDRLTVVAETPTGIPTSFEIG
jgi:acylphosphatase